MKRFLIVITLALVVVCFVKGSEGATPVVEDEVISALNREVDAHLGARLQGLAVAAQLDAWMK